MTVPTAAVCSGRDGKFVFVIKSDDTVLTRMVTTGATSGNKILIETGLTAGERVVTDGQPQAGGRLKGGNLRGQVGDVPGHDAGGRPCGLDGGAEMSISSTFIRRPVATALLMFSIVLFGVIGYKMLPVSDLPNVDFPVIMVTVSYPGANPDTMASAVATPLEKEFCTIAGIDSMTSYQRAGDDDYFDPVHPQPQH